MKADSPIAEEVRRRRMEIRGDVTKPILQFGPSSIQPPGRK
jgi:hypothetical protein